MEKERVDSRGVISDYIFFSKYSRVKPDGKKETWEEAVDRVMQMHREFFKEKIKPENRSAFESLMEEVTQAYKDQRILGSQRTLQYGGPQLLKNNLRSYNCSASYLNRVSFFQELAELLLSGVGTGFSVQKVHIDQLPPILGPDRSNTHKYIVPDSIEGWARSWGILIETYFNGTPQIKFDYSQIREEGSYVSGGFKAPGPLPLIKSHKKIMAVLDKVKNRKLTPFEAHYLACLIADAVISGGIRRSAMISLFDIDDEEMLNCKTGGWFISYPELCRSNNSVVILPSTPKEKYDKIFKSIKEYGEPGIVFLEDQDMCVNPCCFTGETLIAVADGRNAVSIKELADTNEKFLIYYKKKTGTTGITKARAFCTGEKGIVKVILSNGSEFNCTPDHPLQLLDGSYLQAKDCKGKELSKFYTTQKKYRTICASPSAGYNRQYRKIWEYYNGKKPFEFEIDHIDNSKGDCIDNLQLLSLKEHLKKTSEERKGVNNSVNKINDKEKWLNNLSVVATLEKNSHYSGLSNQDLIEIGKKCLSERGTLTREGCRSIDSRFPKGFSKNRFSGSWTLFSRYVIGDLEYQEQERASYQEKENVDFSYLSDPVSVFDVQDLGQVEVVYDIEVDAEEHNFAIITKGDTSFGNCEGVFVHNCEVGLFPQYQNEDGSIDYGWGVCNLTEINGGKVETAGDFFYACRNAAILGTMQAAYTENFPLLKGTSKKIIERDALIGVGITGMADSPEVLFSPEVQRMGAEIVRKTNESVAKILGINPAARTTVVKPSGNSSQLLGTASGIHAYHFRKYIRNIQASNNEQAMQAVKELNPDISAASFWNKEGETVLSFPIELGDEALVRTDFSTLDFLKRIYETERNWIMAGTRKEHPSSILKPKYHHNVSCTVSVREEEWEDIADWIWNHREGFCGLSFLPETGDLDYPQAPYTSYLDEKELADTYGKGAVLSSGLIVDGLKVFGDIWTACNAATGKADSLLTYSDDYLLSFIKKHLVDGKLAVDVEGVIISDVNTISDYLRRKVESRQDWVRRFKKFSKNYFNGDDKHCSNCLKHVNIFHQWHKIKNINPVDWNSIKWETVLENAGEQVGTACAGGACSI